MKRKDDDVASLKKEDQKRKEKRKEKSRKNRKWIIEIFFMAFLISFVFSFVSETFIPNLPVIFGILLIALFIALGIVFDMIGVAVTASDEKPFHSMSSRKVKGANIAVLLKKNADKVGSFCATTFGFNPFFTSLFVTGLIAAITIGGKAIGKGVALNQSDMILYRVAKFLSIFYHPKR